MSRVLAVVGLLGCLAFATPALAQPAPQITITAPTDGAVVSGPNVTLTIQVTGTTLVPAANATKLEDMHVHYMLDVDPAPYLSGATAVPQGNPNIVHSGALSNAFADVPPGPHRVTVLLGLANHHAVQPAIAPAVSFTVAAAAGAAPGQLPRTGDASTPTTPLLLGAGVVGIMLGTALHILAGGTRRVAPPRALTAWASPRARKTLDVG